MRLLKWIVTSENVGELKNLLKYWLEFFEIFEHGHLLNMDAEDVSASKKRSLETAEDFVDGVLHFHNIVLGV